MKHKDKILWMLLALALGVLTFQAVLAMSEDLSLGRLLRILQSGNPLDLGLSAGAAVGFVFFEGEALLLALRTFGWRRSHGRGFLYSAADIYFSAITPSASGGQPASAYFMLKNGIPGGVATAALLVNLIAYTAATFTVGLLALLCWPAVFFSLVSLPKLLIVVGMVILAGLTILFYCLLRHGAWIYQVGAACIRLLCRTGLWKGGAAPLERLQRMVSQYEDCARRLEGNLSVLGGVYLLDLLQRLCQSSVTVFVHLALGGDAKLAGRLFASSALAHVGSNCVPVPGGMGVADYLLYQGFLGCFDRDAALRLGLISRSFSFYFCMILSGLVTLLGWIRVRFRKEDNT